MESAPPRVRHPVAIWAAALFALWGLVYARAASHDFVWDDWLTIVDNPQYTAPLLDSLRSTQHDHLDGSLMGAVGLPVAYESYRPLLFASFKLDDAWFDRTPTAMHVHNLLLGAVCIALAFGVCTRIFEDRRAAGLATALFALHPVQVESFCYVSARSDLLTTGFGLAATLAVLIASEAGSRRRRIVACMAAGLAFVLSLGAKEASAGLPVALAVLLLALHRLRQGWPALATLAAAGGVYFAARLALIGQRLSSVDGESSGLALWHLPTHAVTALRIFAAPYDLSIERLADPSAIASGAGWLLWIAVAGVGLAAWLGRLGRWSPPLCVAVAGLAWALIWIAPSSLAVETMGVLADRYLFAATLGMAIFAVALGTAVAQHSGRLGPYAVGAWALALVAATAWQVGVWRDNETLYANSVLVEPESSMAHYRVGVLRARAARWPEAFDAFEVAVALDEENLSALNNLGVASLNLGRVNEADHWVRSALALSAELNFRAWNNLASVHFAREEISEGCSALRRSLSINPGYDFALRNQEQYCAAHARAG